MLLEKNYLQDGNSNCALCYTPQRFIIHPRPPRILVKQMESNVVTAPWVHKVNIKLIKDQ